MTQCLYVFQFEDGVDSNKFLEHGEFDGNYYGTKFDSIRGTIKSGRICILDLNPQVKAHTQTHGHAHIFVICSSVFSLKSLMWKLPQVSAVLFTLGETCPPPFPSDHSTQS